MKMVLAAIVLILIGSILIAEFLSAQQSQKDDAFEIYIKRRNQEIKENEIKEEKRRAGPYLGMIQTEILYIWGAPDRITETVTRKGKDEIWVYDKPEYRGGYGVIYFYFLNGVLSSYQMVR